jgi:asparagine synthase (glutamine-hydrolysing)
VYSSADRTSTFFRDVFRLPSGHRLTHSSGSAVIAPYWTPDPSREIRLKSDAEYVEAFREVFSAAVRCRLAGSVASMLSGGLDSSTIVGFAGAIGAAGRREPLTTLSAVATDATCEESRHIRAVTAMAGLNPVFVRPEHLGNFLTTIETFTSTLEEPFDEGMVIPLLMYAAARRRGFTAVLDGLEGDVVASHEPDVLEPLLRSGNLGAAWSEARGFARFYGGTYEPWSSAVRLLAGSAGRAFAPEAARSAVRPIRARRDVAAALSESFVSPDLAARAGVPDRLRAMWALRGASRTLTARERQARELTHPQMAAALERYHRVAASQGIEARHPFLDRRVVEFCLALPWDQKVRNGWTKHIVRRATEGLVPDEVRWRRGRWVRLGPRFLQAAISQSRDLVSAHLAGTMSELAPFADLGKLRRLYRSFLDGDAGAAESVWTAAALASWLRNLRTSGYDVAARANGQAALPVHPSRDGGYSHSQEIRRDDFSKEASDRA